MTARARVATLGVAIGVAVMLISIAIVVGFKNEVRQRIIDYSGDLQVTSFQSRGSYELPPVHITQTLMDTLLSVPGVVRAEPFVTKPAVIKVGDAFAAVVTKGEFRDTLFDSRSVTLSSTIARQLNVGVGDKVTLYFVQTDREANAFELGAQNTSIKQRRVTVGDIYSSHFSEIDRQLVIASPSLLQDVSGYDSIMASGVTLWVDDFTQLEDRYYALIDLLMDTSLMVMPVTYLFPQVFSWLELLDTNVWVILILMSLVSAFTMIGGLVIIVLEKTRMIAILKSIGMTNRAMRETFILVSLRITLLGMFWGNLVGIGLCMIQDHWHLFVLDPSTYYLEWVPVQFSIPAIIALNIGTLLVTLLALLVPSRIVTHISPSRILSAE